MKARMVSLYGKNDLRIREVELPPIQEDEILVEVISNGLCLSTYKAAKQGEDHLRVPDNIKDNPIVTGHEFAGIIKKVGKRWEGVYQEGNSYTIQPAMKYKGSELSPGYSYEYFGGNTTYAILPKELMELGLLIPYDEDYYAFASLCEPMSCIIGAFNTNFHDKVQVYHHENGIIENGNMALLASGGPMGIGAIDYAVYGPRKPKLLVVSDINEERLQRAASLITVESAKAQGVELHYVNTANMINVVKELMDLSQGYGYDDVMVFAPIATVVEQGDAILANNGCMNFFSGPEDKMFHANINMYNVHYKRTHFVGNSGGNLDDMLEAFHSARKGILHPEYMVTHVSGMEAIPNTLLHLPSIPGGKKLHYPHVDLPLMAMEDFAKYAEKDPVYKEIAEVLANNNNIWCKEAEQILLKRKTRRDEE